VAQRLILRVEVYARAFRASQIVKKSKEGAAKLRGEVRRNGAKLFCRGLWPSFAYEVSRTEEASERRRAYSADHAGL
jgi:AAA+ superfamily predicted ATPase